MKAMGQCPHFGKSVQENEYGLMALALKKTTDENMNPVYDMEDIYEWIDYVRNMGIDQIFR